MIVERESGVTRTAKIIDCVDHGRFGTDCTGVWIEGGSLVGGRGHVIVGTVAGATSSDVGKTIDVTVTGDHARTTSLGLPITLIVLGLVLTIPCGLLVIRRRVPPERLIAGR
jgi:hypothetical protein